MVRRDVPLDSCDSNPDLFVKNIRWKWFKSRTHVTHIRTLFITADVRGSTVSAATNITDDELASGMAEVCIQDAVHRFFQAVDTAVRAYQSQDQRNVPT